MSEPSPNMRVVDRFVDHGAPLSFRDLCARVLREEHDYLVLDLDKTTHLGRNLGELLAWELCAYEAYGESMAESSKRRWFGGRLVLDGSQPVKMVRYLAAGARRWAWAGIYYLVWGKLASRIPALRRLAHRRFGPEPITSVQRHPQMVALTHLTTADETLLHDLARAVWRRHVSDQVIDREDLDWIRRHSPGIQIILSSASPKAMLDVAVEELGADGATYSTAERINSGRAKIAGLREIHPRVFDPDSEVLAITDTSYGEDHCWTEHFACVIDVNSPTPFAPIVTRGSRTREVHSAILLTREERCRRSNGDAGYLDVRREDHPRRRRVELDRDALSARLWVLLNAINGLSRRVPNPPRTWEIAYARAMLSEASRAMLS